MIIAGKILISLLVPLLVGMRCIKVFFAEDSFPKYAFIALSYGLGLGVVTHVLLLLAFLNIELNWITALVSILGLYIAVLVFAHIFIKPLRFELLRTKKDSVFKSNRPTINVIILCVFLVAAYYVVYSFWTALNVPVHEWDSLATSVYSAKVIYYEKSLANLKYFPYPVYPLHMPLALVWNALCFGFWDDQLVKITFPFMFLSFLVVFYFILTQLTSKKGALLGLALLASSNLFMFHAASTYRDIFLIYYVYSALAFIVFWQKYRNKRLLMLAGLLAGLGAFTKLEGMAYLPVYFILIMFILCKGEKVKLRVKAKEFLSFSVPCIFIVSIFHFVKVFKGISTAKYVGFDLVNCIKNIPVALEYFGHALFMTASWNIVWVLLLFLIVWRWKVILADREAQMWLLALVLFFAIHFLLSLSAGLSAHILSYNTISRLLLHFFPVAVSLIVLLMRQEKF